MITQRQIAALKRRADYLQEKENRNSFDETEIAALTTAIASLKRINAIAGLERAIDHFDNLTRKNAFAAHATINDLLRVISTGRLVTEGLQQKDLDITQEVLLVSAAYCLEGLRRIQEKEL